MLAEIGRRAGTTACASCARTSPRSRRSAASAELALGETDRLDALVNNAGIGTTTAGAEEREESREGFELRFAVNYLAGYLLTRLLLDARARRRRGS